MVEIANNFDGLIDHDLIIMNDNYIVNILSLYLDFSPFLHKSLKKNYFRVLFFYNV